MIIKKLLKGALRVVTFTAVGCILFVNLVFAQGIVNDGIGIRYMLSDGTYAKNCRRVSDGFAMHFDANGYMDLCGFDAIAGSWKNTKKGKRYVFVDGRIPVGGPWLLPDGKYYTFDDNGYLVDNAKSSSKNSNNSTQRTNINTNTNTNDLSSNSSASVNDNKRNPASSSSMSTTSQNNSMPDLEKNIRCTLKNSQGINEEWCQVEIVNLSNKTIEINDVGFVESEKSYTVYHGANYAAASETKTVLESGTNISQLYRYDGDRVSVGKSNATTYMVINNASVFKIGVTIDGTKYWLRGDCNGNTSLEKW